MTICPMLGSAAGAPPAPPAPGSDCARLGVTLIRAASRSPTNGSSQKRILIPPHDGIDRACDVTHTRQQNEAAQDSFHARRLEIPPGRDTEGAAEARDEGARAFIAEL